jgi:C4-dicarboxylate-specific signal transduction histidine kinase
MLVATSKMSALGEMAGSVAHEINNPLATIKNLLNQIQEVVDDDPLEKGLLKEMAATAENTADRINKIILGLRSFSRNGEEDPFEPVNLKELIEETASFCNERFKHKGIKLMIEPFSEDLAFQGSSTQISQVLLNLLNNGHDAVSDLSALPNPKDKWIKVSAFEIENMVEIKVTDCGNGILPEVQEKLFEPFFTTKKKGKGTGIGLSISMKIVRSHNGQLFLDSRCSHTCFVVRLPKAQTFSMEKAA